MLGLSLDISSELNAESTFVALIAMRGGRVEAGRGAGHNGRAERRRYCPHCASRVSRSANRCGYCRRLLPSRKRIAAIVLLLAILFAALAARLTGLL